MDHEKPDGQRLLRRLQALVARLEDGADVQELRRGIGELQQFISDLEKQHQDLEATRQSLESTLQDYTRRFEQAPVGYLRLDPAGLIVAANTVAATLLKHTQQALLSAPLGHCLPVLGEHRRFVQHLRHNLAKRERIRLEIDLAGTGEAPRNLLLEVGVAGWHDNAPLGYLVALVDITERVAAEARLQHDALHDILTGLANRAHLLQRLELAVQRANRNPEFRFALLFVDLDRFKAINDSLGHLVGDRVLIAVAEKLRNFARKSDLAARLGGDEFVLLLEDISGVEAAVQIAERLTDTLKQPLWLKDRELFVSTSIGIVAGSPDHHSASELLRDADAAMYRAKTHRQNRYEIFEPAMHTEARARLALEQELRTALDSGALVLYYQPVVSLDSGTLTGLEALVRWPHPERGLLGPEAFIAMAEETGLILPLGAWVLARVCQQLGHWRTSFASARDLNISVNLSPVQCREAELPRQLATILADSQLPGEYLTLELTESLLINDTSQFMERLPALAALGVQLSIDDFGTGYSSLNYLHRIPVQRLKIDQSVVAGLGGYGQDGDIVQTIMALARRLGLTVVAEGVETLEQLALLRRAGCQQGQGYLFARPLSVEKTTALLTQDHPVLFDPDDPDNPFPVHRAR